LDLDDGDAEAVESPIDDGDDSRKLVLNLKKRRTEYSITR
jgi:hypothetical protein